MARGYRMTPARRAALRKAQLASARKRHLKRRRRRLAVGIAVTSVALGAAVVGHKVIRGSASNVVRFKPQAALGPGRNRIRGKGLGPRRTYDPKNKRWVQVPSGGVFKVGNSHLINRPRHVQKVRPNYDAKRRAAYKNVARSTPKRRSGGKYG